MAEELHSKVKENLKKVFGYSQFRAGQEDIINNLLAGNDTFVIMPTGAGKSLCYQLPAITLPRTALIISPLIALMKNQVDQLNANGVSAYFLNSTLTKSETNRIKKEIIEGRVKLVYLAPESLVKEDNLNFFKKVNVSFIAVDEAHCISEWGHDFRPEYRKIRSIVDILNHPPIIALTATATPKVQLDIQKNLHIENAKLFKSSFLRNNLYYDVRPKENAEKELVRFVKQHNGQSGIIYCSSRKKVEELANFLQVNDVKAIPYHAGMDSDNRIKNQDDFLNEEVNVIVATIAFGMGIDKPDVRFVVHFDAPKSLEGYYQETGRAGRDGLRSDCLLFFRKEDIQKLEKFNKDKTVSERDNARVLLQEVVDYAESPLCRPRQLLHYFGEDMDEDCKESCNNCLQNRLTFTVCNEATYVLKAAKETAGRFSLRHIVDLVSGIENDYIKSYNQNTSKLFAIGKDKERSFWHKVARQLMVYGYLQKQLDDVSNVKITEKGENFLKQPYNLDIFDKVDEDIDSDAQNGEEMEGGQMQGAFDSVLFDLLKKETKKIAKEKDLPPYVVFQEVSLQEMATIYPTNDEELAQIVGVGMGKVNKFGANILKVIKKYVEENDITTVSDVVIKSSVNKSKIKIFIIQQIDRRIDLEEIAESKNITMEELLDEIENICFSGTSLNINYYINQVLDEDKQDEIIDYFMHSETDSVEEAYDYFEEDYTEEEIRLMRVMFMSKYAN